MPTPRPLPDRFQEALKRNAGKFPAALRPILLAGLRAANRTPVRMFADQSKNRSELDQFVRLLDDLPAPPGARASGPEPVGAARLLRHTDAGKRIIARRQGGK